MMNDEVIAEEIQENDPEHAELAARFEALAAEASQLDGEPVKDNDPEPSEYEEDTAELLFPLIDVSADILCPNWALQDGEKKALAKAYGDLLDKYFPSVGGFIGVELSATLVTMAIFKSRLGTPARVEKEVNPKGGEDGADKYQPESVD